MNEKDYGGAAKFRNTGKAVKGNSEAVLGREKKSRDLAADNYDEEFDKEKILKAGKIASQVREYVKKIVKKNVPLLEIAEKIESKIEELGGRPAFPVTTCIDDVTAHSTPSPDDDAIAHGLIKVDFGVHVDGWISDTAVSFDLENNEENKKLIEAAEKALENALKKVKLGVRLSEIGKAVEDAAVSFGVNPIINLSGHSISRYDLHSGLTIPNYDNKSNELIEEGLVAIEPFMTFGNGRVYDGKASGIYQLENDRNVRSLIARKILEFVIEEYNTLPFCSRWIVKKFGKMALFGLKQLEDNGNLHQFEQLIEISHKNVAQAEHTVLISEKGTEVTTK